MDHLGQVFKRHFYLLLSRSKSKNPVYLMCEGVQSAGQYCNNIIDRRSTFGSLNWLWLRVIRCEHTSTELYLSTYRSFTTKESICCSSVIDKTKTLTFEFLAIRDS